MMLSNGNLTINVQSTRRNQGNLLRDCHNKTTGRWTGLIDWKNRMELAAVWAKCRALMKGKYAHLKNRHDGRLLVSE